MSHYRSGVAIPESGEIPFTFAAIATKGKRAKEKDPGLYQCPMTRGFCKTKKPQRTSAIMRLSINAVLRRYC
jgi:hypothetical protein